MERRALLAVVLIFVMLLGYQYYVASRNRSQGGLSEGAPEEVTVSGGEASPPSPGTRAQAEQPPAAEGGQTVHGEAADLPGAGAEVETITVETPLWRAMLINRGAAISSWELKEYKDATGAPVQLVADETRALEVEIRYGVSEIATGAWVFGDIGAGGIVLGPESRPATVRYEALRSDGVRVTKAYTFYPDSYAFDVTVILDGLVEGAARREVWVGWGGVSPTEEKEEDSALTACALVNGKVAKEHLGGLKKTEAWERVGEIGWVAARTKYFICAIIPDSGPIEKMNAVGIEEPRRVGFQAGLPIEGESDEYHLTVYAGPQDYALLEGLEVGLERAVDLGWNITRPLSVLMLKALVGAHKVIPNYGIVIILFSILTKVLFYRLTHKSFVEMKRMQDLQPKMETLKKKHGSDQEALNKARMELYKKEGVSLFGGCGPMLLQMPVFVALFQVLRTTIELRGAPFVSWITDLSKPDTVAHVAGFPIHILPLLMGVGMLVQQRFSSKESSQAAIGNMMPIIFTALFYNFASGLVIYWLVNTVLSVVQQYYIHRGSTPAAATATAADAEPRQSVPGQPSVSTTTEPPTFGEGELVAVGARSSTANKRKKAQKKRRKRK